MSQVFISYRHADSPYAATLIWQRLVQAIGADAVFFDVARLSGGDDWRTAIDDHLQQALVVIAVVGGKWKKELMNRQARAEEDVVLYEIGAALNDSSKKVIPVLVDGLRRVPRGLPPAIAGLSETPIRMSISADAGILGGVNLLVERVRQLCEPSRQRPDMCSIPAGEFVMSARVPHADIGERAAVRVRISQPFRIAKYPVTQREFQDVVGVEKNLSEFADDLRRPVESVSWRTAVDFCNRLSRRHGLTEYYRLSPNGRYQRCVHADGYRLPTDAEWEYACRAGTTTRRFFGRRKNQLPRYGHVFQAGLAAGDSGDNPDPATDFVGIRMPNPWGLHDVYGNVYEWVWDGYADVWEEYAARGDLPSVLQDPVNDAGRLRVARGGSFCSHWTMATSSARAGFDEEAELNDVGFRLAQSCHC